MPVTLLNARNWELIRKPRSLPSWGWHARLQGTWKRAHTGQADGGSGESVQDTASKRGSGGRLQWCGIWASRREQLGERNDMYNIPNVGNSLKFSIVEKKASQAISKWHSSHFCQYVRPIQTGASINWPLPILRRCYILLTSKLITMPLTWVTILCTFSHGHYVCIRELSV